MSPREEEYPSVIFIDGSQLTRLIVEIALRREGIACTGYADGTTAPHYFGDRLARF